MKTFNVWSILKWTVVTLAFAGVVAISRDQIKIGQADRDGLQKEIKGLKEQVSREKSNNRGAQDQIADLNGHIAQMISSAKTVELATENLKNAYENKITLLERQLATTGGQQVATYRPPTSTASFNPTAPQVQIPRWNPQPEQVVLKAIKTKALAKYGTDYSAANYETERQTEAFQKLMRYYRMNTPFLNDLINRTMFERGDDYSGAAYAIDREIEAKQKLDGK
jgi:TolA-binding protein